MSSQGLKKGTLLRHGAYRIETILGQGGFGITYLATDLSLDRLVAIKEFFPKDYCDRNGEATSNVTLGTSSTAELVSRLKEKFLKEARNIAKLDHPSIIKIHTAFEENNTAYYVMDYLDGENLNEMVKQNGPLSESKAIEYISKVGEALEYIHSHNMTHFDVKPANIMVRKSDDMPILIDFGLAKQYDSTGEATSTLMQGVSKGYSPIELYNAGSTANFSPQIDVYSLTATLYFILTGNVPPHATELVRKNISFPTNFPNSLNPIIKKGLAVKLEDRYESISDILYSIKEIKRQNEGVIATNVIQNKDSLYINFDNKKVGTWIWIGDLFGCDFSIVVYLFLVLGRLFRIKIFGEDSFDAIIANDYILTNREYAIWIAEYVMGVLGVLGVADLCKLLKRGFTEIIVSFIIADIILLKELFDTKNDIIGFILLMFAGLNIMLYKYCKQWRNKKAMFVGNYLHWSSFWCILIYPIVFMIVRIYDFW